LIKNSIYPIDIYLYVWLVEIFLYKFII